MNGKTSNQVVIYGNTGLRMCYVFGACCYVTLLSSKITKIPSLCNAGSQQLLLCIAFKNSFLLLLTNAPEFRIFCCTLLSRLLIISSWCTLRNLGTYVVVF